ncbi:MAG: sugar ABC transporter permease [Spirochaetaceae bacterium]|nr:MAG: sugar ABC transporter permease [Spirochaetaceae bacterium]
MKTNPNIRVLLFAAPALLVFIAIKLVPVILGMGYSLTNWNGIDPSWRYVGIDNFVEIFTRDAHFWTAMVFTIRYSLFVVILLNVLALGLALAIESQRRTRGLFRTIFYLPNMISMIIGGYMWNFIFTQVVYHFSDNWGWMFFDQSWIGDPTRSFYAILTVAVWGGAGYLMVIYIAALQSVPQVLQEAATIDGAGSIRRFFSVTLPMIKQAFTICLFISLNNAFQVFDVVFALTGGGPGRSTQVVAINIYEEAFARSNRFGYATAKSTVLFAVLLAVTAVQLWIMKRREEEL